jgi:putative inorganic carbon (HCO3(-)) transporter
MPLAWALAALAAGLMLARLPLGDALALTFGSAALALAAWEPALGLGLALGLGPARAFIAIAFPGVPADLGQLFFAVALAGWLARGLAARRVAIAPSPLLLLLGAYAFVGLLSLLGAPAPDEGLKEALKWVEVALALIVLVSEQQRGRRDWIIAAVLVAGMAQAAVGLWQFEFQVNGPEHFRFGDHFRAYGSFEQPNPYGGFLGLIWPVAAGLAASHALEALRRRERPPGRLARLWPRALPPLDLRRMLYAGVYAAAAVLILAGVYVSFSRGAWLGTAAAGIALVLALPRRWWLGLALAALAGAAGLGLGQAGLLPGAIAARLADVTEFVAVTDVRGASITTENFAIIERLAHWQAAEAMAQDHPWLGVGLGNYAAAYPRYSLINWPNALGHAHMIYLNVLAETGGIGLAAYAALWLGVVALTLRAIGRARGVERGLALGLLGAWAHLSVHQIVDNLYVNNIHLTLAALLGLLLSLPGAAPASHPERAAHHPSP